MLRDSANFKHTGYVQKLDKHNNAFDWSFNKLKYDLLTEFKGKMIKQLISMDIKLLC